MTHWHIKTGEEQFIYLMIYFTGFQDRSNSLYNLGYVSVISCSSAHYKYSYSKHLYNHCQQFCVYIGKQTSKDTNLYKNWNSEIKTIVDLSSVESNFTNRLQNTNPFLVFQTYYQLSQQQQIFCHFINNDFFFTFSALDSHNTCTVIALRFFSLWRRHIWHHLC